MSNINEIIGTDIIDRSDLLIDTGYDRSDFLLRWMPCMENAFSSHIGVIIGVSGAFGLTPIAAGLTGVIALECFG